MKKMKTSKKKLREFSSFIEKYNNCFYERNINALKNMYATDGDIVFFDNHIGCDSTNLDSHLDKVQNFFDTGNIEELSFEILKVYENSESACLLVRFKYPSGPVPSVRTTFYLENGEGEYKIRHIHYSFDLSELDTAP
jgi:hypothetical protein